MVAADEADPLSDGLACEGELAAVPLGVDENVPGRVVELGLTLVEPEDDADTVGCTSGESGSTIVDVHAPDSAAPPKPEGTALPPSKSAA